MVTAESDWHDKKQLFSDMTDFGSVSSDAERPTRRVSVASIMQVNGSFLLAASDSRLSSYPPFLPFKLG